MNNERRGEVTEQERRKDKQPTNRKIPKKDIEVKTRVAERVSNNVKEVNKIDKVE